MTTTPKRVCVVSGSRADYGLLRPVMEALRADLRFELKVLVTGMHLSPEFGYTASNIEADGFAIEEKVDALVAGDTPAAVGKSMGLGVIGFADVFRRLTPDWLVVLGDRFEIFAAVQAAFVAGIPIAHIAGGDTTEGAFDEGIRHSISKMAHLHFATNADAAARLRQMGEDPSSVHVVGSPAIDLMQRTVLLDRAALAENLGVRFYPRNFLITYHPVTLSDGQSIHELNALLAALDALGPQVGLFFTGSNADPGGRELTRALHQWVTDRPNARVFTSLGELRYWSLAKEVDAMIGNSSSGLYEAPSLGTPTVNIGDRQRGRLAADSVVHCRGDTQAIAAAIEAACRIDMSATKNPYGDGTATPRIVAALAAIENPRTLLKKRFTRSSAG